MKRWEELIYENVFGLGGHQDHLSASLAHMLYCIVAEEQYNLAYFFVKRIECAWSTQIVNLLYGMFLTRLYRYVMEHYPHLDNGIYNVVDRVMRPLALKQTRKPQSDRGKACHSVSSTSAHYNYGSLSRQGDDDEDDGASRSNDTKTPSPKHQLSSPSALNAPSKTPSTKDTSSSSIDYIPKSPTSSTSPSTNGYLNSPTSPPPRVPPPPPIQESGSMNITLTPPITPLDVQFNTSSPYPPLFGYPIPLNLLEAHGDSCLCCIHNRTLIFGLRDELEYMFSYIEHMLSQPPPPSSPPPPSLSPN
ncbi:hypothetical protein Tco_1266718 [Tanacetum coccineum]